jgi:hypothetical protein
MRHIFLCVFSPIIVDIVVIFYFRYKPLFIIHYYIWKLRKYTTVRCKRGQLQICRNRAEYATMLTIITVIFENDAEVNFLYDFPFLQSLSFAS